MIGFFLSHQALLDITLMNCGLALAQFVVLRAGIFSVATAGLAAIGAYTAGILTLSMGFPAPIAILAAGLTSGSVAVLLSMPLARLRGVFQAIATLAFGQIVLSLALNATPVTGGANGLNGIPKTVDTWQLMLVIAVMTVLLANLGRSKVGRAFDVIREDETVAVSLGIAVGRYHMLAFALSGIIAGITGGLMACHNYSVVPDEFGFGLLVTILSFVVLGSRRFVAGPLVGAVILTWLPELARPLADNRQIIYGALLMVVIIYLPHGVVDSLWKGLRQRREKRDEVALVGSVAKELDHGGSRT